MLSKNRISEIQKLHLKKFREEQGLFLVEGTKSVMELMESKWEIEEVFATGSWIEEYDSQISSKIEITEVSPKELERISCLKTPQEVLAIARFPKYTLTDVNPKQPLLVLDGIRDPGNLGTIIRSADWFGIRQIVCSSDTVELTNPKTIQATMGSFSRVKLLYTDLPDFLEKQPSQKNIYGTFMEGTSLYEVPFQTDDILVIGNEGKGISDEVSALISKRITIPGNNQEGTTESLNASIATAILLYQYRCSLAKTR